MVWDEFSRRGFYQSLRHNAYQVWRRVENPVLTCLRSSCARSRSWKQVETRVENRVGNQVAGQVSRQVRSLVEHQAQEDNDG